MTITLDVWAAFLEHACSLNEYAEPDRSVRMNGNANPAPIHTDSPGTDFNHRGSWAETGLFDAGWTWVRQGGDRGLICRPGKTEGVSASVGMVTSKEQGWPLFWSWSTSCPEFVPEKPYTRFAVYAILNHRGDFSAAAKALADRGYGKQSTPPAVTISATSSEEVKGPEEDRIFRWSSELKFRPENDKWIWNGYLSRGGITLLSALWKSGKTTLLKHLLKAFDGRRAEFLGRNVESSRVLYITEEHEELWAERRDELGIGDHVGFVCRPFRGRSTPAQWAGLIGNLVSTVSKWRFDLVVFDTLSKIWPVREENDAGQVEEALMPLWGITEQGAALLLVHHNRKSGGEDFTGMRGSGGLPAFCETLIEFSKWDGDGDDRTHKRLLRAGGRYSETPEKLLIELTSEGYQTLGDPDDPACRAAQAVVGTTDHRWQQTVMEIIEAAGKGGATAMEIDAELRSRAGKSVRREVMLKFLQERYDDGELVRTGTGKGRSGFRFYSLGNSSVLGDKWGGTSTGTANDVCDTDV